MAKAGKLTNVPSRTLADYLKAAPTSASTLKSIGRSQIFSLEEEKELVVRISERITFGRRFNRPAVAAACTDNALFLKKKVAENRLLSPTWMRQFRKRNPGLRIDVQGTWDINAMDKDEAVSAQVISEYYMQLGQLLRGHKIIDKPEAIYVLNKIVISSQGVRKCDRGAMKRAQAATKCDHNLMRPKCDVNSDSEMASCSAVMLSSCKADGKAIPPLFVVKEPVAEYLLTSAPPGTGVRVFDSKYASSLLVQMYLEHHLTQFQEDNPNDDDDEDYIMVLYDDEAIDICRPMIQWALQNKVILFHLPPHASKLPRTQDDCFTEYQTSFNAMCLKGDTKARDMTQAKICAVACDTHDKAFAAENIKSLFKDMGIYPFKPQGIEQQ